MNDSFNKIFKNKKRVMVVFAHPDDLEVYAGGTIKRLINEGKEVRSIKMTAGGKGSRENVISEEELIKERRNEDQSSMHFLGISEENSKILDVYDGYIEDTHENIEKVVLQIREFKPDLIITHNPEDVIIRYSKDANWINHRDHLNTGKIATYAAYPFSRDINFFPSHFDSQYLSTHAVKEFLYVDFYGHSDEVFFDIDEYFDVKVEALSKHKTQFSKERANETIGFLTRVAGEQKKYERFRYVVAD